MREWPRGGVERTVEAGGCVERAEFRVESRRLTRGQEWGGAAGALEKNAHHRRTAERRAAVIVRARRRAENCPRK